MSTYRKMVSHATVKLTLNKGENRRPRAAYKLVSFRSRAFGQYAQLSMHMRSVMRMCQRVDVAFITLTMMTKKLTLLKPASHVSVS